MESSPWHIDAHRASLRSPWLGAQIDLDCPAQGLLNIAYHGLPLSDLRLLLVRLESVADRALALTEHYIRGADLVARYAAAGPHNVQPEIYWRAIHSSHGAAGIDLLISMQTSQLDSDPRITNHSLVPAGEIWCLMGGQPRAFQRITLSGSQPWSATGRDVAGAFLFRLTGTNVSYLEIIAAAELAAVEMRREDQPADSVRLSYQLFPERLEKGVMRRVPVRSLLLPRAMDQHLALDHYHRTSVASPPLAT